MGLISLITSDAVLDAAYEWVCQHRSNFSYQGDVGWLRRNWAEQKCLIQQRIRAGCYSFRALQLIRGADRSIEWWCSRDALVLKAIAIVLTQHLAPHLSERCFHLAGRGGLKGAVRAVQGELPNHEFVFRTDVQGYYASINHAVLMEIVGRDVQDEFVLSLLWSYLKRDVVNNGRYLDITQGISLGCPLSPLMGALYLKPLDDRMAQLGCFYARYMDDWVILAPTRWKLRQAIRAVNEEMAKLRVHQHPEKTFIGRIARGFDFLGYWFSPSGFGLARKTVERMLEKVSRLDEQGADEQRIETYLKHWWRWVRSGVRDVVMDVAGDRSLMVDGLRVVFPSYPEFPLSTRCLLLIWVRFRKQCGYDSHCC